MAQHLILTSKIASQMMEAVENDNRNSLKYMIVTVTCPNSFGHHVLEVRNIILMSGKPRMKFGQPKQSCYGVSEASKLLSNSNLE